MDELNVFHSAWNFPFLGREISRALLCKSKMGLSAECELGTGTELCETQVFAPQLVSKTSGQTSRIGFVWDRVNFLQ